MPAENIFQHEEPWGFLLLSLSQLASPKEPIAVFQHSIILFFFGLFYFSEAV